MSRTEVTKQISVYIKKNNLQDNDDRRKVNPDANLIKLFKMKKGDILTYFNLQRYIAPHLIHKKN